MEAALALVPARACGRLPGLGIPGLHPRGPGHLPQLPRAGLPGRAVCGRNDGARHHHLRCGAAWRVLRRMQDAQVTVGPMTAEELRRAITRPASAAACAVESDLLSVLIAHTHGQTGALPLLSHALVETWRHRKATSSQRSRPQVASTARSPAPLIARAGLRHGEVADLHREDNHLLPSSMALGCPVQGGHLHVVRRENVNGAWAKSRRSRAVPLDFLLVNLFASRWASRSDRRRSTNW